MRLPNVLPAALLAALTVSAQTTTQTIAATTTHTRASVVLTMAAGATVDVGLMGTSIMFTGPRSMYYLPIGKGDPFPTTISFTPTLASTTATCWFTGVLEDNVTWTVENRVKGCFVHPTTTAGMTLWCDPKPRCGKACAARPTPTPAP